MDGMGDGPDILLDIILDLTWILRKFSVVIMRLYLGMDIVISTEYLDALNIRDSINHDSVSTLNHHKWHSHALRFVPCY